MGVIFDFLNELDIAMEADDITKDAIDNTNATGASDENNGDIDLNTDDILGINDNGGENDSNGTADDSGDVNPDEQNGEAPTDDSDTPTEEDADASGNGDSDGLDLGETKGDEDPFSIDRKKKLRNQFIHFFDILDDSIKLVTSHVPNVTDVDTIRALNNVTENLTQCKTQVYDILTDSFQKSEYHELLKKYVALNRIYDLSIKIMERYFEKYRPDNDVKKKDSKKDEKEDSQTSK